MVHVPCNFGHTIERDALMSRSAGFVKGIGTLPSPAVFASFKAQGNEEQWSLLRSAMGSGGEAWGMMNPDLRLVSDVTKCDMYYTPQKWWPEDLARRYLGRKAVFGMLRDPYDKMVNEFRMQQVGLSSAYSHQTRRDVSVREGSMEREGLKYQMFWNTCDVNGWLKEELRRYKSGDRFRGNCHLLPQAEFFAGDRGVSLAVDARFFPQSFVEVVQNHGYTVQAPAVYSGLRCEISAWSLDAAARALVREVYAEDFDLVCKHFGHCDRDELTCLSQVPGMCGGAPRAA